MKFQQENLILPMVSHQTRVYHMTVSELLIMERMIWLYAYEVAMQVKLHKASNQSGIRG